MLNSNKNGDLDEPKCEYPEGSTCGERGLNCCYCGGPEVNEGTTCGCPYCWSCNACDACKGEE